tara:strand:+ start:397 stop:2208 length:1812 start_codon:yes stop_codon:yes gene_type:complete
MINKFRHITGKINKSFLCNLSEKYNNNITVSQYIVERLLEKKINKAFGYNGGAALPFFDEIYKFNDFDVIINRHEQSSGHCAQAYSKMTNNLGVLITTSGPGFTNVITPLQDAYSDGIPLLCISGQVSSNVLGSDAFQECHAIGISRSCVKDNHQVQSSDNFINIFEYFLNLAEEPRYGPVHVDICKDIFNQTINIDNFIIENNINFDSKNSKEKYYYDVIENNNFKKDIKVLFNKINLSKKPVVIFGAGSNKSYKNARKFIEKFNLPSATTLHGLGIIDENSKKSLKMIGMHGSYHGNKALEESDLIIGIGNRFDDRTIGKLDKFGINAKNNLGIIHIDNSKIQIDKLKSIVKPNLSIKSETNKALISLLEFSDNEINIDNFNKRNKWLKTIQKWKSEFKFNKKDTFTGNYIMQTLSNILKDNDKYILTTGVGSHQMVAAQYFNHKFPNCFITSGSLGTMGVGLPFAIGAQIAKPENDVILIDGDGSFTMSLNDMATIIEYNLPIKMFVFNDSKLRMVNLWQELFYEKRIIGSEFKYVPEFHRIGESYNIKSYFCENKDNVEKVIKDALNYKGPVLVNFKIDTSYCLPFVPPNTRLGEMITE